MSQTKMNNEMYCFEALVVAKLGFKISRSSLASKQKRKGNDIQSKEWRFKPGLASVEKASFAEPQSVPNLDDPIANSYMPDLF